MWSSVHELRQYLMNGVVNLARGDDPEDSEHLAMVGREQHIADQLDTTTSNTDTVQDRQEAAYCRARRCADLRNCCFVTNVGL